MGCISLRSAQAWTLDVTQMSPALLKDAEVAYSRMDFYMEQFIDCLDQLRGYMVADGEYACKKPFLVVTKRSWTFIST